MAVPFAVATSKVTPPAPAGVERLTVNENVVVPEFWTVLEAHDAVARVEKWVLEHWKHPAEIVFHVDPCRRAYCARCPVEPCAVRVAPFTGRPDVSRESIVGPPAPVSRKGP